MLILSFP